MPDLYTIGHSNHPIETFLGLLRMHGIEAVADVRSHPYSRRHPQYRRDALLGALAETGIDYAFLGRELGARTDDPACHRDGRVDFARLAHTARFRTGLDVLADNASRRRVAIMCAEKDPLTCHRTILVWRALTRKAAGADDGDTDGSVGRVEWTTRHIHADGRVETGDEADARLLAELGIAPDLLRGRDEALAEAYRLRGEQIAWTAPETLAASAPLGAPGRFG